MSVTEIIGTVLGVVGVALMIRQSIWGWPIGLVQVAVYAVVFFRAKLYSDVLLQGAFFVIQAYGWWHWARGGTPARQELPVTRLPGPVLAGGMVMGALATAGWGRLMQQSTDAALPYWDAGILVFSLLAQWLQALKKLENWLLWLAVNTVAIGVYWTKDLRLTAGLYAVFWGMALWGWRAWVRGLEPVAPRAAGNSPA